MTKTLVPAADIIRALELALHPEGGHFRETFRDDHRLPDGRAASTAIYYLLTAHEVSKWHRIDSVEVWHWYGGAPLELRVATGARDFRAVQLGDDILAGQRPQAIVPAHWWQSARSLGAWSLVGCTVAPGFDFGRFEMAPDAFDPMPRPAT